MEVGTGPDSGLCLMEVRNTSLGDKDRVDMGSEREEEGVRLRSDCWQGMGSESKSEREKVRRTDRASQAMERETGRRKDVVRLLGTWEEEAP